MDMDMDDMDTDTDMDMHGDGRNARGRGKGSLLCSLAVRGGHGDLNLTCCCLVVTICSWLSARSTMQRAAEDMAWHGIDTAWSI